MHTKTSSCSNIAVCHVSVFPSSSALVPDCACSGQRHLPPPQPVQGEEGRRGGLRVPRVWPVGRRDSGIYGSCHAARHAGWWHGGRGGRFAHPEPLAAEEYQHSAGGGRNREGHLRAWPGDGRRSEVRAGEAPGASAGPARPPPVHLIRHHLGGQVVSLSAARERSHPPAAARSWWVSCGEGESETEPQWPLVLVEGRNHLRFTHTAQQTVCGCCAGLHLSRGSSVFVTQIWTNVLLFVFDKDPLSLCCGRYFSLRCTVESFDQLHLPLYF